MLRKTILEIISALLLANVFVLTFDVEPVMTAGTIYIRADGSVDPSTAPIQRVGSVYTFTGDVYEQIVVEGNSIIIDGNNHKVQGTEFGVGITLSGNNITIKKIVITGFSATGSTFAGAIYSLSTFGNVIKNNTIFGNKYGIYLEWADHYVIGNNTITNHSQAGIYLSESRNNVVCNNMIKSNKEGMVLVSSSSDNKIYHNSFIDNTSPGFTVNSDNNLWDDGYPSGGNYWSDYTGVDANDDGIGDTAYARGGIMDRYPLTKSTFDSGTQKEEEAPFWMEWWFWLIITVVIVALVGAVFVLKRRRGTSVQRVN